MTAWLSFLATGAVVAAAGFRLARAGDTIAAGTGLGGLWVGAILVAGVTSLPELTTDASAILQGHPDLAVGDLLGSSMANMMILAVADLLTRDTRLLTRVAVNQALLGSLAIFVTTIAVLGILAGSREGALGLGWSALFIGIAYLAGIRLIHRNREEPPFRTPAEVAAHQPRRPALRRAVIEFSVTALVIFLVAPHLARSAGDLSVELGLAQGFVGLLFLAVATSLPEAAVTIASVRAGSYNLAVGNLLGSNCFNMAAVVPLDVVEGPGSLLGSADAALAVPGLFAVLLMSLALLDVLNKSERRLWAIEPGPAAMIGVYLLGLYFSFRGAR
jgi:cation:H+ antiporter